MARSLLNITCKDHCGQRRMVMKGLTKRIDDWLKAVALALQNWWTAIAFAEQGEHETALKLLGHKTIRKKSPSVDDLFTAITFAEAGLPDTAMEFLEETRSREKEICLELPGVKIWTGSIPVEDTPLAGVKIWSGMVTVSA